MLRFPPRLSWDLFKVRVAQKFSDSSRHPLALHIDLADFTAPNSAAAGGENAESASGSDMGASSTPTYSTRESQVLEQVRRSSAPVVWIGGDTPLHYPRIGQLTREIVDLGRTMFIEMDGTLLRRRIHEFKPVAHLYLVLPIYGLQEVHDARAGKTGNFRGTLESIRTARLSGFHVCVQTTIRPNSQVDELHELTSVISKLSVDGWILVPSAVEPVSAERLAAEHELIPNSGWKKFSEMVSGEIFAATRGSRGSSRTQVTKNFPGESEPTLKHIPEPPSNNEGLPAL
jgi:hypothetical protein